jgi:hypothetical protein
MADYFALQAVFAAVDRTERRYHADPATQPPSHPNGKPGSAPSPDGRRTCAMP